MTEDRREIQTPYGVVRLTEEAAREEFGPTPEEQKLAHETYVRQSREREEREKANKINIDDVRREQGKKEIAEFRQTQRNLWITHGGTDEEFVENWPRLKADYLQQKARDAYANVSSPFDR